MSFDQEQNGGSEEILTDLEENKRVKDCLLYICDQRYDHVPSSTPTADSKFISRVPAQLRRINPKAYEPTVLAIGPYHNCDNPALKGVESHKKRYLQQFLDRDETRATAYLKTMHDDKAQNLRSFYSEARFDSYSDCWLFALMMILDCVFIFELIRKYVDTGLLKKGEDDGLSINDPVFASSIKLRGMVLDMLLYENQLPFFILENLFERTRRDDDQTHRKYAPYSSISVLHIGVKQFKTMALFFLDDHLSKFGRILPRPQGNEFGFSHISDEFPHLLGLLHAAWCPSYEQKKNSLHNISSYYNSSATELRELAGLKFKKREMQRAWSNNDYTCSLFEIRFNVNGTLEIPVISIEEETETLLRNLMVYEYFIPGHGSKYVTHYIFLMNFLMKTNKDAELLCDKGIIKRMGYDSKATIQFFRSLGTHIEDICYAKFYYCPEWDKLEIYCGRKRNKLKAWCDSSMVVLRRDYFNSCSCICSACAYFCANYIFCCVLLQVNEHPIIRMLPCYCFTL